MVEQQLPRSGFGCIGVVGPWNDALLPRARGSAPHFPLAPAVSEAHRPRVKPPQTWAWTHKGKYPEGRGGAESSEGDLALPGFSGFSG